jgi:hypothetical protein
MHTCQPWWPPPSHSRHGAPLPAPRHTTISKHATQWVHLVKTRKKKCITIIFTIMCTTHQRQQCGCRRQCPQPRMDRLQQFRCNSIVLWTYCHHPVTWFPQRRLGRQSKYGQRGGDLGGSTTVHLALSTCAFSPPDKLADSNASIPLPSMLLMKGCKGIGWEGLWEELFVRNRRCS